MSKQAIATTGLAAIAQAVRLAEMPGLTALPHQDPANASGKHRALLPSGSLIARGEDLEEEATVIEDRGDTLLVNQGGFQCIWTWEYQGSACEVIKSPKVLPLEQVLKDLAFDQVLRVMNNVDLMESMVRWGSRGVYQMSNEELARLWKELNDEDLIIIDPQSNSNAAEAV